MDYVGKFEPRASLRCNPQIFRLQHSTMIDMLYPTCTIIQLSSPGPQDPSMRSLSWPKVKQKQKCVRSTPHKPLLHSIPEPMEIWSAGSQSVRIRNSERIKSSDDWLDFHCSMPLDVYIETLDLDLDCLNPIWCCLLLVRASFTLLQVALAAKYMTSWPHVEGELLVQGYVVAHTDSRSTIFVGSSMQSSLESLLFNST